MFDKNGYPTEATLRKIRNWCNDYKPGGDMIAMLQELMSFVEEAWYWPDWGFKKHGRKYTLHTGGWSGNESIIRELERNFIFWSLCWVQSQRGGHYIFEIPKIKITRKEKR